MRSREALAATSAILDALDDGVIQTDVSGIIVASTRRVREILGTTERLEGQPAERVLGLPGSPIEMLGDETKRVLEHNSMLEDASLHVTLTVGQMGPEIDDGFFIILRDLHDEKLREVERRRFEHLAALGTMVAGFAHEIRNPVAALRSIAEELSEVPEIASLSLPHTGRMLRVLERMERLVKTSLQFGRPTPARAAAHRPWTVCSAALAGVSARTMSAGQPVRVEVEPDLPDIVVDHGQLAQVLVILLDNALDAAGSPAGVLLRVTRTRSRDVEGGPRRTSQPPPPPAVRFEVIDDGPGIASGTEQRIFDPFFTTKSGGTGLGLSIAKQLVMENRGRIEVTSMKEPTTLSVLLPTAEETE